MPGLLVRMLITAAGLWIASAVVSGLQFDKPTTLMVAAILLGLANALIRPVIVILTLPITVITLGLFLLVINAAMLKIVAGVLSGFTLDGFGAAFLGALIVSITSWLASRYIGPRGRYEVLIIRRNERSAHGS